MTKLARVEYTIVPSKKIETKTFLMEFDDSIPKEEAVKRVRKKAEELAKQGLRKEKNERRKTKTHHRNRAGKT